MININIVTPCYSETLYNKSQAKKSLDNLKDTSFSYSGHVAFGTRISSLRNALINDKKSQLRRGQKLNNSYTHWLFIDSDIGYTKDNILQLLVHDKDIISGAYLSKDNIDNLEAWITDQHGRNLSYISKNSTGLNGITGSGGITGANGITGSGGVTGSVGVTGSNGITGSAGITGGSGIVVYNMIVLKSGTSWTPDTNMSHAIIELYGGGGGGGGATGIAGSIGGGGGSGGYAKFNFTGMATTAYTYAIGGGGPGGSGASLSGATGGITSFSTGSVTIYAYGGNGGLTATPPGASHLASGGAGAPISSGGHINGAGGPGMYGIVTATATIAASGAGGTTKLGGAGNEIVLTSASSSTGNSAVNNTGSGGGGACVTNTTSAAGGQGSTGIIIITEYR